jgi:hypothetical protein
MPSAALSPFLPPSFSGRCLGYREWAGASGYEQRRIELPASFLEQPCCRLWQGGVDFPKREYDEGLSVTLARNVTAVVHSWAFDKMERRQLDRYVHLISRAGHIPVRDSIWIDTVVGRCFAASKDERTGDYAFDLSAYPPVRRIEEPAFYIGSHRTWGHWICDHVGRLELRELFSEFQGRRLVLDDMLPFHDETLRLWGIDPASVIVLDGGGESNFTYLFDDLAVAGDVPLAQAYDYIRRHVQERAELAAAPPGFERVFLSRARLHPHHRIENGAEVEGLLAGQGFTTIYPEEHSILEMARLLKDAKLAVLPVGSGWANLLFASSDMVVVNLMPHIFSPDSRGRLSPLGLRLIDVFRYYYAPFLDRMLFVWGRPLETTLHPSFNDNEIFDPRQIDLALMQAERLAMFRARAK